MNAVGADRNVVPIVTKATTVQTRSPLVSPYATDLSRVYWPPPFNH
jgi:hypothetical protein